MKNKAISMLFATYIHEGKWEESNVPEYLKDDVLKIVSELQKEEDVKEVDEHV